MNNQRRRSLSHMIFPLALLSAGAAQAAPVPPAGLFDVMITSNCFFFPEQANLTNPYWHIERVSVWPG